MEIILEWKSQDEYSCFKSDHIIHSLKEANYILSTLTYQKDFKITSNENKNLNFTKLSSVNELTFDNNNSSYLEIEPTSNFCAQVKCLMNICRQKEKKYSDLKGDIEKYKKTVIVSQTSLTTKAISLIKQPNEYYYKLRNKIRDKLLNYKSITKEINDIQQKFIKYKASKIMTLYYKMAYERFADVMSFVFKYGEIFNANDKILPILIQAYQYCVRSIVQGANVEISKELEDKDVYKEHVNDYRNIFNFIVKFFELFPLLKTIDMKNPQVVFSALDEPINLQFDQRTYYHVKMANMQLPTYENLQYEFKDFKDDNLRKIAIEMTFKRDFALYKKYGMLSNQYVYSSLLFEN